MTLRKDARNEIARLLGEIPDFAIVFPYEIDDFGQNATPGDDSPSPVAIVHSDGTNAAEFGDDRIAQAFGCTVYVHALLIHIFARRNPPASEDQIDDLSAAVLAMLEANTNNAVWHGLEIDNEYSALDYYMAIKSVHYRHEAIRILIW